MVTEATKFNAERIKLGTVDVRVASSSAIPFPSASFDRVLALNTIYFWSEPSKDLAEICRVLRPNGRLVLGCLDPAGTRTAPVYKQGFSFYEKDQLVEMLKTAGFLRSLQSTYSTRFASSRTGVLFRLTISLFLRRPEACPLQGVVRYAFGQPAYASRIALRWSGRRESNHCIHAQGTFL